MWGGTSPLLSGHHCLISGRLWSQAARAEALRVGSKLTQFLLSVCSFLFQHWHPQPQRGVVLGQEGLVCAVSKHWGMVCGDLATLWDLVFLLYATCAIASNGCPLCAQMLLRVWATILCYGSPYCGAGAFVRLRLVHVPGQLQEAIQPAVQFQSPSLTCFQSKQVFTHSSWVERRLPTALLSVPLVLGPAKGAHLPFVGFQDWGAQYVAQIAHSSGKISACVISLFL